MREKDGYRDQLTHLNELYPNRVTLSVSETAKALGIDRRTVVRLIDEKKLVAMNIGERGKNKRYIIPLTAVAKFAVG